MTTPVSPTFGPVTTERIFSALDRLGVEHARATDGSPCVRVAGLVCFFRADPSPSPVFLRASGRWLATARTRDDVTRLRLAINEVNRAVPLVRVHPVLRRDGSALAVLDAAFFTNGAASDAQVCGMLEFFFAAASRAVELLSRHDFRGAGEVGGV